MNIDLTWLMFALEGLLIDFKSCSAVEGSGVVSGVVNGLENSAGVRLRVGLRLRARVGLRLRARVWLRLRARVGLRLRARVGMRARVGLRARVGFRGLKATGSGNDSKKMSVRRVGSTTGRGGGRSWRTAYAVGRFSGWGSMRRRTEIGRYIYKIRGIVERLLLALSKGTNVSGPALPNETMTCS